MKARRVVLRQQASGDVDEAIAYYLQQVSEQSALGFIDALARAFDQIGRHPAAGSSRYAHELNLPGLRSWPLARYPYVVFYAECPGHIDVWRVLHGQRDIAAWLREPEET
jgi:toxin ParE1/3/4